MFKIFKQRNLRQNIGGVGMKKLKLPIIKGEPAAKKILTMDEYLTFVEFNLKHNFNKKAYLEWKKMSIVDVPFVIK